MGTPITDRINSRVDPDFTSEEAERINRFVNRRPAWVRRMDDKQLPAKDFSNGAWTPAGSDGAA